MTRPTRIKVLDEAVINRIAAGEVIERPVSVVKELVENSIDAQATSISIDIENGGRKLVRIRDNGVGMSPDDAFLALERHATSKLSSEKDLVSIATMGFRGEALASIASVSKLRLVTKNDSDAPGWEVVVEGGRFTRSTEIGTGRGTTIEVTNLFYNVPVRKKFLKGPGLEADYIQDLVVKFALAFPGIGFSYSEDGRTKIDLAPMATTFERVHSLYPKDLRGNLATVNQQSGRISLTGFVARPPYARSSMKSVLTYVNGRSVKDRLINMALNRSFANLMERGRYPFAILFLELPAEEVDVNVHPQKAEVRFVNGKQVSDLITDGVYEAIMGFPLLSPLEPRQKPPFQGPRPFAPVFDTPSDQALREPDEAVDSPARIETGGVPAPASAESRDIAAPFRESEPPVSESAGYYSLLSVLGALPNSFVLLHNEEELVILDHHAAHERLIFDKLLEEARSGRRSSSQGLLLPEVLEYPPLEAHALREHLPMLEQIGFEIEAFGDRDFVVKGIPDWWDSSEIRLSLDSLIQTFLDTGIKADPDKLRDAIFKKAACQSAVKETRTLTREEIKQLLKDLDTQGSARVCPHGRPIALSLSFNEIRRKMGRK
jgi:DNA mismatch repair protein MutL